MGIPPGTVLAQNLIPQKVIRVAGSDWIRENQTDFLAQLREPDRIEMYPLKNAIWGVLNYGHHPLKRSNRFKNAVCANKAALVPPLSYA